MLVFFLALEGLAGWLAALLPPLFAAFLGAAPASPPPPAAAFFAPLVWAGFALMR